MPLREDELALYLAWARSDAYAESLQYTRAAIRLVSLRPGPVAVAVSWGKDSVVLADIAIELLGDRAILVNLKSPYAIPGWEVVRDHFAARARVVELGDGRSVEDVIAVLRDIGLGVDRDPGDRRQGSRHKATTIHAWCRDAGVYVNLLGMRAEENPGKRGRFLRETGGVYWRGDITVSNPLAWWSGTDIWAHITARGLPYNAAIYDRQTHGYTRETLRNAGWLTTIGRARVAWLRQHHPALYRRLEEEFPAVRRHT